MKNIIDPITDFADQVKTSIAGYRTQEAWQLLSRQWMDQAFRNRYMYNFSALGRPIIQTPVDMAAFQEIVWAVRPDLVIETGIAHGGSLIQSAAMLSLLDYCDAIESGQTIDPTKPRRRVLGIDIDIRAHNRAAIEAHPMAGRIDMIEGSSIAAETVAKVAEHASRYERVLVCLDSNHTHDHVLAELQAYAPLTTTGSYCLVFDTIVEDLPCDMFPERPWRPGNSPKTAVHAYMKQLALGTTKAADGELLQFAIDHEIENKLLLTVAPDGYLKRISL